MVEHFCQFDIFAPIPCASLTFDPLDDGLCGKLAHFDVGDGCWLCADHYDIWIATGSEDEEVDESEPRSLLRKWSK